MIDTSTTIEINSPNLIHLAIQNGGFQVRPKSLTKDEIYYAVKQYYSITDDVLKEKTRKRHIVKPRQICMYLMHEYFSLKDIANFFGGFDHTTVLHSKQTVIDLMATDKDYAKEIKQIRQNILIGVGEFYMETISSNNFTT